MQPLPLNQRLDRIGQHIVRARLFLDLWFYFEERDSRRKIIETMQEYNEFFRFTPHAYFVAYVIYMAGVFDKRSDTISLPPLVREVKAAGQLIGQDAAAVDALLVEAKPVADKILILRHKSVRPSKRTYLVQRRLRDGFRQAQPTSRPDGSGAKDRQPLATCSRAPGPILYRASPRSGGSNNEGAACGTAMTSSGLGVD
jgi:HEPN superfamily AbiU2-like protein